MKTLEIFLQDTHRKLCYSSICIFSQWLCNFIVESQSTCNDLFFQGSNSTTTLQCVDNLKKDSNELTCCTRHIKLFLSCLFFSKKLHPFCMSIWVQKRKNPYLFLFKRGAKENHFKYVKMPYSERTYINDSVRISQKQMDNARILGNDFLSFYTIVNILKTCFLQRTLLLFFHCI